MRFWFHFNKPASQAAGKPKISVHIQGACRIVDNVDIKVATKGRVRKQQPRFVVAGRANRYWVEDGTMVIR